MDRAEFLHTVQASIERHNLFTKDDRILVGVSGGVDSMTLVQSLYELGYSVAIAHCNFNLRGEESDGDQQFVAAYANVKKIPIHVCSFDTRAVAHERKISIEMAARDLRYEWFETVCQLNGYTKLAIAHNQNDSVETFFINLLRSAGLKGLSGIPIVNGQVVRPLLEVSRKDIEDFASQSRLAFRVDSSNLGNDYLRNKIRNGIIPKLQEFSPNCLFSITASMSHLKQSYAIYNQLIEEKKMECCTVTSNGFVIDETALLRQKHASTLLFEFLYPCGFNSTVVSRIFETIGTQSGKRFESDDYVVVHDRNCLCVERKQAVEQSAVMISGKEELYELPQFDLHCSFCEKADFRLNKNRCVASLDLQKLKFPLIIRPWHSGDSFVPFGMSGRKKVSDFLIDEKVPLLQKQRVTVLESDGEIVWVVGYRISHLFAVTDETQHVAQFTLKEKGCDSFA